MPSGVDLVGKEYAHFLIAVELCKKLILRTRTKVFHTGFPFHTCVCMLFFESKELTVLFSRFVALLYHTCTCM